MSKHTTPTKPGNHIPSPPNTQQPDALYVQAMRIFHSLPPDRQAVMTEEFKRIMDETRQQPPQALATVQDIQGGAE